MSRATPLPGMSPSNAKLTGTNESKPIISPIEKGVQSFTRHFRGSLFGPSNRTIKMVICYKDSVLYSLYALGYTFLLVNNPIFHFDHKF